MRGKRRSGKRGRGRSKRSWWWSIPIGVGRFLAAPFLILYTVVTGRRELSPAWVRAYLVYGPLLLILLGVGLLTNHSAEGEVFAALGRFDPQHESLAAETKYSSEVNTAASRHKLNPQAVYAVIQIESGGNPWLISPAGARGLMQIMPRTWKELNPDSVCTGQHGPRICEAGQECIFAPWGNVRAGTQYLATLMTQNKGDLIAALQAYNAGQANVVFSPRAKFPETRQYLSKFLSFYRQLQATQLNVRLSLFSQIRRLILPIFYVFTVYLFLALLFFWRAHSLRRG